MAGAIEAAVVGISTAAVAPLPADTAPRPAPRPQASVKTEKQRKKDAAFRPRKFAVKQA
jgi:hypothetical protein